MDCPLCIETGATRLWGLKSSANRAIVSYRLKGDVSMAQVLGFKFWGEKTAWLETSHHHL